MARIEEERQILKKDGKYFSLFDYAFFEGTPFEVYYLGFSNTTTTSSTNKRIKSKCCFRKTRSIRNIPRDYFINVLEITIYVFNSIVMQPTKMKY